jgi:adenine C2-methylase RlmN of 23S rRNA A2503 and tRNA A37
LGEPSYRTGQITDRLYKNRVNTIDEMTDMPRSLRARLMERFSLGKIDLVRVLGARDTTRKFLFRLADGNLKTLLLACDHYFAHTKRRLTFEYILIADVNDTDQQARLLSRHAPRVSAKVNLIPYNNVSGLPWTRPSESRQAKICRFYGSKGFQRRYAVEKDRDIDAACGQLRLQMKRDFSSGGSACRPIGRQMLNENG